MTDFSTMTDKELRTFKSGKYYEIREARAEMEEAEAVLQELRANSDPEELKRIGVEAYMAGDYAKADEYRLRLNALTERLAEEAAERGEVYELSSGDVVSVTIEAPSIGADGSVVAPGE
jgi:hypothetical protein